MAILASNQVEITEVISVGELKIGDHFTDDQGDEASGEEYVVIYVGHGKVEALRDGDVYGEFDCLDLVSITRVVSK